MEIIYKLFKIGNNRGQPSRTEFSRQDNHYSSCGAGAQKELEPSMLLSTSEKGDTITLAPPPFSQGEWTCEREHYRYPIDELPKDPWQKCHDVVDKSDQELCGDLKDEISYLLVVASLFLAIVTAFTIESLKWIQPSEGGTQLTEVIQLLNESGVRGGTQRTRDEFHPKNRHIVVNQLWFLSMTLSLSAVVVGTLCLQWLSAFRRIDVKHKPHDDALALRQLRYEGLMAWGVPRVPAILLLTVQGALVLFAIGLLYLLWSVNKRVALPVAIVSGVSIVLLTLTTLMPLLQSLVGWILPQTLVIPQCPYKSPISWVVHRFAVSLAIVCSLPFCWLPRIETKMSEWRTQQLKLLTDYLWQEYDELWRRQRERWGPQKGAKGYSYYLVRGLAFAMEMLVFQPNAVHIIHSCLQDFHGTKAEVETFEKLFSKDFNPAEEELLQAGWSSSIGGTDGGPASLMKAYIKNLPRDFLNALALQHFVAHNQKLHRTLLPHRVELYIRIKNSSQVLRGESQSIGNSLECPIRNIRDAQALSQGSLHSIFRDALPSQRAAELRIQFLKCADALMSTDHFENEDAEGTRNFVLDTNGIHSVLEASEDLKCGLMYVNIAGGGPSTKDELAKAVTVILNRLPTSRQSEAKTDPVQSPVSVPSPEQSMDTLSLSPQDDQLSISTMFGVPEITGSELYQSVKEKLEKVKNRDHAVSVLVVPR